MRLCELEEKEVINACDCKRLGFVADLIIDLGPYGDKAEAAALIAGKLKENGYV